MDFVNPAAVPHAVPRPAIMEYSNEAAKSEALEGWTEWTSGLKVMLWTSWLGLREYAVSSRSQAVEVCLTRRTAAPIMRGEARAERSARGRRGGALRNLLNPAYCSGTNHSLREIVCVVEKEAPVKRTIAIQVGAVSFLDEGVEPVLDIFQERAGVNALFLATHTFDRGTGGRQIEGCPLPDHGVQEYDRAFRGGNFAATHGDFYRNTFIRGFEAPERDTGGKDVLEEVLPSCRQRGMEVYCWINENPFAPIASYLANFALVSEVDLWGRRTGTPCFNHPDYRNWHLGLVEDYVKSYDIAGIAWASERQGPLGNLMGGGWNTRGIGCFCEHCRARAAVRGLDGERASKAFRVLSEYFDSARSGQRPRDGYFVTFWRLLLEHPEILAWQRFWTEGLHAMYAEIYGLVKAIDRRKKVGWHIMHLNSFSPFYRAEQDYAELARYSDFIKVVAYHNCAGGRFRRFVESLHQSIFRDADPEDTYRFLYKVLGIDEAAWKDLSGTGFSADYVARETNRALEGVDGHCEIWPGIDIDIPVLPSERNESPDDVKAAVLAAFRAGAQGVVLSRKYSEMRLANLSGAGAALRELG